MAANKPQKPDETDVPLEEFDKLKTGVELIDELMQSMGSVSGSSAAGSLMLGANRLDNLNFAPLLDKITRETQDRLINTAKSEMAALQRNGFGIPEAVRSASSNIGSYNGLSSIMSSALEQTKANKDYQLNREIETTQKFEAASNYKTQYNATINPTHKREIGEIRDTAMREYQQAERSSNNEDYTTYRQSEVNIPKNGTSIAGKLFSHPSLSKYESDFTNKYFSEDSITNESDYALSREASAGNKADQIQKSMARLQKNSGLVNNNIAAALRMRNPNPIEGGDYATQYMANSNKVDDLNYKINTEQRNIDYGKIDDANYLTTDDGKLAQSKLSDLNSELIKARAAQQQALKSGRGITSGVSSAVLDRSNNILTDNIPVAENLQSNIREARTEHSSILNGTAEDRSTRKDFRESIGFTDMIKSKTGYEQKDYVQRANTALEMMLPSSKNKALESLTNQQGFTFGDKGYDEAYNKNVLELGGGNQQRVQDLQRENLISQSRQSSAKANVLKAGGFVEEASNMQAQSDMFRGEAAKLAPQNFDRDILSKIQQAGTKEGGRSLAPTSVTELVNGGVTSKINSGNSSARFAGSILAIDQTIDGIISATDAGGNIMKSAKAKMETWRSSLQEMISAMDGASPEKKEQLGRATAAMATEMANSNIRSQIASGEMQKPATMKAVDAIKPITSGAETAINQTLGFMQFGLLMAMSGPLMQSVSQAPQQAAQMTAQPFVSGLAGMTGLSTVVNEVQSFVGQIPQITGQLQTNLSTIQALSGSKTAASSAVSTALDMAKTQPIQFPQAMEIVSGLNVYPETKSQATNPAFQKRAFETTQYLSMLAPEQGIGGALFAIRELLGGQTRSLERRFNVSTEILSSSAGKSNSEFMAMSGAGKMDMLWEGLNNMFGGKEILMKKGMQVDVQAKNLSDTLIQSVIAPLVMDEQPNLIKKQREVFSSKEAVTNLYGSTLWDTVDEVATKNVDNSIRADAKYGKQTSAEERTGKIEEERKRLGGDMGGTVLGSVGLLIQAVNNSVGTMLKASKPGEGVGSLISDNFIAPIQETVSKYNKNMEDNKDGSPETSRDLGAGFWNSIMKNFKDGFSRVSANMDDSGVSGFISQLAGAAKQGLNVGMKMVMGTAIKETMGSIVSLPGVLSSSFGGGVRSMFGDNKTVNDVPIPKDSKGQALTGQALTNFLDERKSEKIQEKFQTAMGTTSGILNAVGLSMALNPKNSAASRIGGFLGFGGAAAAVDSMATEGFNAKGMQSMSTALMMTQLATPGLIKSAYANQNETTIRDINSGIEKANPLSKFGGDVINQRAQINAEKEAAMADPKLQRALSSSATKGTLAGMGAVTLSAGATAFGMSNISSTDPVEASRQQMGISVAGLGIDIGSIAMRLGPLGMAIGTAIIAVSVFGQAFGGEVIGNAVKGLEGGIKKLATSLGLTPKKKEEAPDEVDNRFADMKESAKKNADKQIETLSSQYKVKNELLPEGYRTLLTQRGNFEPKYLENIIDTKAKSENLDVKEKKAVTDKYIKVLPEFGAKAAEYEAQQSKIDELKNPKKQKPTTAKEIADAELNKERILTEAVPIVNRFGVKELGTKDALKTAFEAKHAIEKNIEKFEDPMMGSAMQDVWADSFEQNASLIAPVLQKGNIVDRLKSVKEAGATEIPRAAENAAVFDQQRSEFFQMGITGKPMEMVDENEKMFSKGIEQIVATNPALASKMMFGKNNGKMREFMMTSGYGGSPKDMEKAAIYGAIETSGGAAQQMELLLNTFGETDGMDASNTYFNELPPEQKAMFRMQQEMKKGGKFEKNRNDVVEKISNGASYMSILNENGISSEDVLAADVTKTSKSGPISYGDLYDQEGIKAYNEHKGDTKKQKDDVDTHALKFKEDGSIKTFNELTKEEQQVAKTAMNSGVEKAYSDSKREVVIANTPLPVEIVGSRLSGGVAGTGNTIINNNVTTDSTKAGGETIGTKAGGETIGTKVDGVVEKVKSVVSNVTGTSDATVDSTSNKIENGTVNSEQKQSVVGKKGALTIEEMRAQIKDLGGDEALQALDKENAANNMRISEDFNRQKKIDLSSESESRKRSSDLKITAPGKSKHEIFMEMDKAQAQDNLEASEKATLDAALLFAPVTKVGTVGDLALQATAQTVGAGMKAIPGVKSVAGVGKNLISKVVDVKNFAARKGVLGEEAELLTNPIYLADKAAETAANVAAASERAITNPLAEAAANAAVDKSKYIPGTDNIRKLVGQGKKVAGEIGVIGAGSATNLLPEGKRIMDFYNTNEHEKALSIQMSPERDKNVEANKKAGFWQDLEKNEVYNGAEYLLKREYDSKIAENPNDKENIDKQYKEMGLRSTLQNTAIGKLTEPSANFYKSEATLQATAEYKNTLKSNTTRQKAKEDLNSKYTKGKQNDAYDIMNSFYKGSGILTDSGASTQQSDDSQRRPEQVGEFGGFGYDVNTVKVGGVSILDVKPMTPTAKKENEKEENSTTRLTNSEAKALSASELDDQTSKKSELRSKQLRLDYSGLSQQRDKLSPNTGSYDKLSEQMHSVYQQGTDKFMESYDKNRESVGLKESVKQGKDMRAANIEGLEKKQQEAIDYTKGKEQSFLRYNQGRETPLSMDDFSQKYAESKRSEASGGEIGLSEASAAAKDAKLEEITKNSSINGEGTTDSSQGGGGGNYQTGNFYVSGNAIINAGTSVSNGGTV